MSALLQNAGGNRPGIQMISEQKNQKPESVYKKNLLRFGIILIAVSVLDMILELVFYKDLSEGPAMLRRQLQTPTGICIKDGLGFLAGILACYLYQCGRHFRLISRILVVIVLAELLAVFLSIHSSIVHRVDGVINATLILTTLVAYTALQTERSDLNWERINRKEPDLLDLKLQDVRQWFDPIQIAPCLALNQDIASVVNRYLDTAKKQRPLEINIRCPNEISEAMRATMQETFQVFYEHERQRINSYLERRYIRVMSLVIISIVGVTLWINLSPSTDEGVTWTILSNFAAFSLWQIGYTYFERAEGYDDLLRVQIALMAKLRFWND